MNPFESIVFNRHEPIIFWVGVFLVLNILNSVNSSRGDRDYSFVRCKENCMKTRCNGTEYIHQLPELKLLGWDCFEECNYQCMWETVQLFQEHELYIPQFYGKWPFLRIYGIQEPASVIASLCNLLAHLGGIISFRRNIPSDYPFYWFWHLFAFVGIHGWIWSAIFHTRDFPFTELMDYFCAFSMVSFSFFAGVVRTFEDTLCTQVIIASVMFAGFFSYHCYYLAFIKFDYGYNLKATITFGIINAGFWLFWCWRNRKKHPNLKNCVAFIVLLVSSILLEVNDFPPIYWILDAHSLWHFSTAIITPLWYKFLIVDAEYLYELSKEKLL